MDFYCYSIIIPEAPSRLEVDAAEMIAGAIYRYSGKRFPVSSKPLGDCIYIGAASRFFEELGKKEYIITADGSDIHIAGGHTYSTYEAAEYFCERIIFTEAVGTFRGEYGTFIRKDGQYKLRFSDDFEGNTPDLTKWLIRSGTSDSHGDKSVWENEAPYLYIEDSVLHMNGGKTGNIYHSVEIDTGEAYNFTYGYAEIKAKNPPSRNGVVPAFWFNSRGLKRQNTREHPLLEIDGYESFGNSREIFSAVHEWFTEEGELIHHQQRVGGIVTSVDTSEGFHTYGVEWNRNYMAFYFDGREYCRADTGFEIFRCCHEPVCLILSNQVGLKSFGPPEDKGEWYSDYQIDWVHIYRRGDDGCEYTPDKPYIK